MSLENVEKDYLNKAKVTLKNRSMPIEHDVLRAFSKSCDVKCFAIFAILSDGVYIGIVDKNNTSSILTKQDFDAKLELRLINSIDWLAKIYDNNRLLFDEIVLCCTSENDKYLVHAREQLLYIKSRKMFDLPREMDNAGIREICKYILDCKIVTLD